MIIHNTHRSRHEAIAVMVEKRGYQLIGNPVHEQTLVMIPRSSPEIQKYERAINKLPEILGDPESWVLTGGLAIPATTGEFYRVHRALKIGLCPENLEKILRSAADHQYALVRRVALFKPYPFSPYKNDMYESISPEEAIKKNRTNLRLVEVNNDGTILPHNELTTYLDLFMHWQNKESFYVSNDDLDYEFKGDYFSGAQYQTKSGIAINVVNLAYLKEIKQLSKSWKKRAKHDEDIRRISIQEAIKAQS